jgi:hypothetical protein
MMAVGKDGSSLGYEDFKKIGAPLPLEQSTLFGSELATSRFQRAML